MSLQPVMEKSSSVDEINVLYFSTDDDDEDGVDSPGDIIRRISVNQSNPGFLGYMHSPDLWSSSSDVCVNVEPPTPACVSPDPDHEGDHVNEDVEGAPPERLGSPEEKRSCSHLFMRSLSAGGMKESSSPFLAVKNPRGGRLSLDITNLQRGGAFQPRKSSIFSKSPVFRHFKLNFSNDAKNPFWKQRRKASDSRTRPQDTDFNEYIKQRRISNNHYYPEDFDVTKTKNKLLRYEFDKDVEYLGEVSDNKAQGYGILLDKGHKFGGFWENGSEYIGCFIWKNGVKYCGFWSKSKRNGEGVEQRRKYTYKGEWVDDQKEGYGVMGTEGGCKYEGTWHKNKQEGYGIEVYKDQSFYAGQFDAGIRSGYGVRVMNPTSELLDAFVLTNKKQSPESDSRFTVTENDDDNSYSIFTLSRRRLSEQLTVIYEGQWKNDCRHGHGVEKNSRGEVFEGSFKDNKRHGFGILKNSAGHITYGKWIKNEFKANKRILSGQAQRSAIAAKEAATVAQSKAKLANDRAEGARKCASAATESHLKALREYETAEDRRQETLNQLKLGNSSINIVAKENKPDPNIYSTAIEQVTKKATDLSKDFKSRLSDMAYLALSPKHSRKNIHKSQGDIDQSSITDSCNSTPTLRKRRSNSLRSRNRRSLLSPSTTSSPILVAKYNSPDSSDKIAVTAR